MTFALIDNGSLEPAAHLRLRRAAAAIAERAGLPVHALSWKHSDRIPAAALAGQPAWTLAPWIRAQLAQREHEFVFVPFFSSVQGAIGSALRRDLKSLQHEAYDFDFRFAAGLAARHALAPIVASRVRETLAAQKLLRPAVIVVDHGGPSASSAALRDRVTGKVRSLLGTEVSAVSAASLEGADHVHSRPLLADLLATPGFNDGDVVVAPLFFAPGRHAGPAGDIAEICRAATARCHVTGLIGDHPNVVEVLAGALRDALARTVPTEAGGYVS